MPLIAGCSKNATSNGTGGVGLDQAAQTFVFYRGLHDREWRSGRAARSFGGPVWKRLFCGYDEFENARGGRAADVNFFCGE